MSTQIDRARGAVYGHLIGDALGVPYEFSRRVETVEWRGYGTHDQPAGTWSDDGALMLATLDSLLDAGFDPADQGRRFLDWRDRGEYTPNRDGLRGRDLVDPLADRLVRRLDASRVPLLPEMDPEFAYSLIQRRPTRGRAR